MRTFCTISIRNAICLSLCLFSITFFSCQSDAKDKTPESVKEAFKAKYPGENDPDWRTDKNGYYESHFKKDGEHFRADFTPDGKWVETEESIKAKKLPKVILDKLAADYSDYKVVEVEKVDHHAKGVFYDVELKKDGTKMDVEFTKEGRIIN